MQYVEFWGLWYISNGEIFFMPMAQNYKWRCLILRYSYCSVYREIGLWILPQVSKEIYREKLYLFKYENRHRRKIHLSARMIICGDLNARTGIMRDFLYMLIQIYQFNLWLLTRQTIIMPPQCWCATANNLHWTSCCCWQTGQFPESETRNHNILVVYMRESTPLFEWNSLYFLIRMLQHLQENLVTRYSVISAHHTEL